MPDEPANTVAPAGRRRADVRGDVPAAVQRRYFTDEHGGPGLGFYVDTAVKEPAFRDLGGRLATTRNDPNVIRDLVAIARHRGWASVAVTGTADFRREAWLEAAAAGLKVRGHRPSARDRQALERRLARASPNRPRDDARAEAEATARRRIIEAVVRNRIVEPELQARLLATASERLRAWFKPAPERRGDRDRA